MPKKTAEKGIRKAAKKRAVKKQKAKNKGKSRKPAKKAKKKAKRKAHRAIKKARTDDGPLPGPTIPTENGNSPSDDMGIGFVDESTSPITDDEASVDPDVETADDEMSGEDEEGYF